MRGTATARTREILAALLVFVVANGCGDASPGPGSDAFDAGPEETREQPGLEIVELTVTPDALTEGQEALVRAILRDPEGLDDIVSTFVFDDRGTVVTSLNVTPEFGVYEARLSWALLNTTERPLNFVGTEERTFRAKVTDGVGNSDEASFSLRLSCGDGSAVHGACAGRCVNLHEDRENCGACGHACGGKDVRYTGCFQGVCHAPTGCSTLSATRSCKDECASQGRTCANVCFDRQYDFQPAGGLSASKDYCTYSSWWYLAKYKTCEEPSGGNYVRCCCSE